jgi:Tc5 transposase DNA-binding domain
MPKTEATRKPREKPAPYQRKPKKDKTNVSKTSAKPAQQTTRQNLTLSDWLTVLKYVDEHPGVPQGDIVDHFKTRIDGALHFSQSALSRAITKRSELEARSQSNPTAMSSKRPRIVTRPDVERALVLWVRHMLETKNEVVSGPMLREKRKHFEDLFNVPDDQRLTGEGWVASFCATYNLKECRCHGEAGSVDLKAVEKERERLQFLMETFKPRDRWNFDETSLFPK